MTHHHLVTNFSGFEARGFIPLGGLEVSYISRVRVYSSGIGGLTFSYENQKRSFFAKYAFYDRFAWPSPIPL